MPFTDRGGLTSQLMKFAVVAIANSDSGLGFRVWDLAFLVGNEGLAPYLPLKGVV